MIKYNKQYKGIAMRPLYNDVLYYSPIKIKNMNISNFIVVDDDVLNNVIYKKYISNIYPGAKIHTFENPYTVLEYIMLNYAIRPMEKTIVFLDVQMPGLTGWDVLDRLMHFPENITRQISVYMLTSSGITEDHQRARIHPLVAGYFEKPGNMNQMEGIFSEISRSAN